MFGMTGASREEETGPMKIACSIVGIEGLQSATAPGHSITGHSAAGAPTASFAESLGESLTNVIPDASGKLRKPEILTANGKQNQKMVGTPKGHSVEPGLPERPKSITKQVAVLNEQGSLPVQCTKSGIASDKIMPAQNDAEKVSSGKIPEISKSGGQAPVGDESTEAQTGKSVEQDGVPHGLIVAVSKCRDHGETDFARKIKDTVKASSLVAGEGKEAKLSPHRKAKREAERTADEVQGLQQNSSGDSPAMIQTIAAAGSAPVGPAVFQAAPGESSQDSSGDVEQIMPSGRKATAAHVGRKGQHNQPELKRPSHDPVNRTGETSEKPAKAPLQEGRTVIDTAATKADADGNRSPVEDKTHAVTQAASAVGSGGTQTPLHTPVIQSPDKIAVAVPAHLVHTPQTDTPVLRTIYAPGEHGTISATPTTLEVGVPGGAHGWLKVRAELGGDGSVHASMSPSSAAGAETLRREIPQLTSYLHQEQVGVSSVVVHTPHNATEFSNQALRDGGGQTMNGGSPDARREDTGRNDHGASHSQPRLNQTLLGTEADGDLLPRGFGSAGGWLSVRA